MRMIFDDRAGVLHILSDDDKSFFDITKANAASADPTGMMGEMQKQLEKMPKEQRAQAEMMMKGMMGTTAPSLRSRTCGPRTRRKLLATSARSSKACVGTTR